jgi:hypothetical protein
MRDNENVKGGSSLIRRLKFGLRLFDDREMPEKELIEILLEHGIVTAMFGPLIERDIDDLYGKVLLLVFDTLFILFSMRKVYIEASQVVDKGENVLRRLGFGKVGVIQVSNLFGIENGWDVLGRAEEVNGERVTECVDKFTNLVGRRVWSPVKI